MTDEEIQEFLNKECDKNRMGDLKELFDRGLIDFSYKEICIALESIENALINGGKMTTSDGFFFTYIHKYFLIKMVDESNRGVDIKKDPEKYINEEKKKKTAFKLKQF